MFQYIFMIIILLFSLAFIMFGVYLVHRINNLTKKCTLKIISQVIDYSREQRYDNDSTHRHFYHIYIPIVKCYIDGNEIIKKLNTGHSSPKIEVGGEIEVFFNPNNYDEFYTSEDKTLKTVGIVMICIGIFSILCSSIFIVMPILFNDMLLRMIEK